MQKYNIIYADPPWGQYKDKASAGNRGAGYKYPTMSLQEICDLPIKKIAADNCFLFLWITMPLLFDAEKVFKAWGFSYKTCGFNWIKMNKKKPTPFMGMGSFTRSNSELCLLGIRGKPKRVSASVSSVVLSPIREHSKKPSEIRDKIVQLCGDMPRIELFARDKVEGWDSFGNELSGFDIKKELYDIIKTIA